MRKKAVDIEEVSGSDTGRRDEWGKGWTGEVESDARICELKFVTLQKILI